MSFSFVKEVIINYQLSIINYPCSINECFLSFMKSEEQQHPQYHKDRQIVNILLAEKGTDYNLAELARLKIRYRGFPGAKDIQVDLEKILQKWELTEENLYEKTREIHRKGQVYKKHNNDQEDWF